MSTVMPTGAGLPPSSGGSGMLRRTLVLLAALVILFGIMIFAFSQCDSCQRGFFNVTWGFGGGPPNVAGGDTVTKRLDGLEKRMDLHDGDTTIHWTEQRLRDLICDQLKKGCNKPAAAPKKAAPKAKKKCKDCTPCDRCDEPVTYYTPPPVRQRDGDYETITIYSDRGIAEVYTDLLDAPGVEPVTPGKMDRGNRRFYPSDPNTHEVKFRVPRGTKLPHATVKDPKGEWSADHTKARVRNNQEETDPNYNTSWQRNDGPKHPMDTDDSTKANGDWSYTAEDPKAIQSDDKDGVWNTRETH